MLNHSSATPHTIKSTKKSVPGAVATGYKKAVPGAVATGSKKSVPGAVATGSSKTIISNAVKRRAQAIINDRSIDAPTRAIIRYGLKVNDPWLADLVRRVNAGEPIIETIVVLKHPHGTP